MPVSERQNISMAFNISWMLCELHLISYRVIGLFIFSALTLTSCTNTKQQTWYLNGTTIVPKVFIPDLRA